MPEKFPKPVYHTEPIKIPKRLTQGSASPERLLGRSLATAKAKMPEVIKPKTEPKKQEKDALDKVLDVLEDAEKKITEKGALKLIGKELHKGAEALTENPFKKIFKGVWEGFKRGFKKKPEDYEKMEMPKGSTLETEAESIIDMSRPGATKKELGEEVAKIEKQGLTPKEKETVAFNRLSKKKR